MRNYSSLSKHLLCVIVRKCVYTVIFSALHTKHLLLSKMPAIARRPCLRTDALLRMICFGGMDERYSLAVRR
jgi:hypothetical protein